VQKQKPMVTFDQAFQAAQRKALGQAIASSITPPRVKDALRVVRRETK
jgi:hypothetical protein